MFVISLCTCPVPEMGGCISPDVLQLGGSGSGCFGWLLYVSLFYYHLLPFGFSSLGSDI